MTPLPDNLRNRRVPVPHALALPDTRRPSSLIALDARLQAAARAAVATTPETLESCHFATEHPELLGAGVYLRDELSDYLPLNEKTFDARMTLKKAILERRVAARLTERFASADSLVSGDFAVQLSDIHRRLGIGINGFRSRPVFTRADSWGNAVEYPPAALAPPLISSLQLFLQANVAKLPALSAMVALVGVVHAHPFTDGNGRTARTLFNALLALGCGTAHFLPLSLIAFHSGGGFILKLRRAMHGGEWAPLMEFMIRAVQVSHVVQSDAPSCADGGGPFKGGVSGTLPSVATRSSDSSRP